MRLLVFLALVSVCQCFYPLETGSERYDLQPRFVFNKDEYLRQIGRNARVSYANPFLKYHPYIPISYGYPQYNPIGPYDSLARHIPLPNEIPISNDLIQSAKIIPTVLTSQRQVLKDPISMPITLTDAPKGIPYKVTPGWRSMDYPGTYYDLIQQILKGMPNIPTASVQQHVPHYINLDTNIQSKQPIISLNNGDGHVTNLPDRQYIMHSIYDNIKIHGEQEILNYAIGLMLSEKYLSAGVVQVITGAENIDFSKLDDLDETQLVKLSNQDIVYLKRYIIKILNAYGLTNYTFKLLEYLYLIEGTPKTEIQLLLRILTDDGQAQDLNRHELQILKRHLLRFYEDYNESPYMLAFLKDILQTKFRPTDDIDLPILDIDYGFNNVKDEEREIDFVIRIMISENNVSPEIVKVLNSARNLDISKMNKLAEIRLDQMSEEDLARLKKYLVQIINVYGLTTYTFKLMEYIFILEGRPIQESYLMSLIMADNTAVKEFNEDEVKLIYEHLRQIYRNYNESPYILTFLKDILENQFEGHDNFNTDTNDYVDTNDAQQIHVHLNQTYNNNPNILKILKIINDIYGYMGTEVMLPTIGPNDLQSLTTMDAKDLNLLAKYILHVISQRGNTIYFNRLLSYINWIQNSKMDTDITISNQTNITSNATEEKIDLSPIYQYLLDLNISNPDEGILIILNNLSQKDSPVTTLHSIETLSYGDLIRIKVFLLHNGSIDLSPAILDFIHKLNQAIQKQEAKVILEGDQLVEVSPDDLEVLKQYMESMQKAVPNYYLNEILQIIKQAQNPKDENSFRKLKYFDLMQIYKYLLQGGDIKNHVFIKVQQYVNENNHDTNVKKDSSYEKHTDNILETNNVVNGTQVNLEVFYNVLLHKSVEDKSNPLLLELLKYFKETLLMPNGKLKIKILTVNSTKPEEYISPNVLEKLLPFLVNLRENTEVEDNYLYAELLKYLKNKIHEKDYDTINNPLYDVPIAALYRIKIYLEMFMKKHSENKPVYQIIMQIIKILKNKQKDNYPQMMSNDINIKKEDLKILFQYLTKYIEVPASDKDYSELIEYIIKTENDIKSQEVYEKNLEYLKLFLMKLNKSSDITPAVKEILQFLIINKQVEDPSPIISLLKESHKLDELSDNEIHELLMYLHQMKTTLGPNEYFGLLIDNIQKLQEKESDLNNNTITMSNDTQVPEIVKINIEYYKIPAQNMKIINKYLIDLFYLYSKDDDVTHILYKFNHVKEGSNTNKDINELVISSNNNGVIMKTEDLKNITGYIINFIHNHGINEELMKMLRVIFNFNITQVEDDEVSILGVNNTHVEVAADQKYLERKQKYFDEIAKDVKLYRHLLNVLPIVYPQKFYSSAKERDNKRPNNIHALVIRHGDLKLVTKYVLELIRRNGLRPELINVLFFVCDIYDDNEISINGHIDNQTNDLVVSEEMRVLFQDRVMHKIQNMNTGSLKNLYMELIYKLFESLNFEDTANTTQVIGALLDMYKKEETSVSKYILIKLLDYLKNNEEMSFEALWHPDRVLVLLDIIKETSTVPPDSVNQISSNAQEKKVTIQPYDYKSDIQGSFRKLVKTMYQQNKNDKYTINKITEDGIRGNTQSDTEGEKVLGPINANQRNKNIVASYKMDEDMNNVISRRTQPNTNVDNIQKPIEPKEENHKIMTEHTLNEISAQTEPNITVEKVFTPTDTKEKSRNIVVNNTVYEINDDRIHQRKIPNMKPIDTNDKNNNISANYSIYEKTIDDGIQERTRSNVTVEKNQESNETKGVNKNKIGNNTIYTISENGKRGRTEPNIKVEKVSKSIDTNEINKNLVANYTIGGISKDEVSRRRKTNSDTNEKNKSVLANSTIHQNTTNDVIHGQTESNINVENNTKEENNNIIGNNTLYQITKEETHGQTQPSIKVEKFNKPFDTTNEKRKKIIANYTVIEVSDDGIREHTVPHIKVTKVINPIAANEKNKNVVAKYMIEEMSEDKLRRRKLPDMKSIDSKENNKNTLANSTIHQNTTNDVIHGQTESNINVENNHERINMKEHNKNIIENNTIYQITKDDTHGQLKPNIKVEKLDKSLETDENGTRRQIEPNIKVVEVFKPNDTNEKNKKILVNYTVYETSEDGIHQRTIPNIQSPANYKLKEQNNNFKIEHTINGTDENGTRRQIEPNIKVLKVVKPNVTNEKAKNILVDYTVYGTSKDGIHQRTLPNSSAEKIQSTAKLKEQNNNINTEQAIIGTNENGTRRQTEPNIKVFKPKDTNEKRKNIVLNYTVYETSEDGIHQSTLPNIGAEKIQRTDENGTLRQTEQNIKAVKVFKSNDTNEKNKNILVNHTIYENSEDGIHQRTLPNIGAEKIHSLKEKNNNITTDRTINGTDENGTRIQTEPNIKVVKLLKPNDTKEKTKNVLVNYTVYETIDDGTHQRTPPNNSAVKTQSSAALIEKENNIKIDHTVNGTDENGTRRQTEPNIKVVKVLNTNGTNEKIKNIMLYETSDDGIHPRTLPNIGAEKIQSLKEQKNNIKTNHTINGSDENGTRRQIEPNIKVVKVFKPNNTTEDAKNILVNYTVYETSEDGIHQRTLPNIGAKNTQSLKADHTINGIDENGTRRQIEPNIKVFKVFKPNDTIENTKNILVNYTLYKTSEDGVHQRTLSNISTEKIQSPAALIEKNYNIKNEHTINGTDENGTRRQIEPNMKVLKVFKPNVTNEKAKDILVNYTVYETSEDGIHQRTLPNSSAEKIRSPAKLKEQNNNIKIEHTNNGTDENGTRRQTEPNTKVVKSIDSNEKTKNILFNYTVYEIGEDGMRRRTQSNVDPGHGNEKIKNILANYSIHENTIDNIIDGQTQSNINSKTNYERINTKEQNKNIIGNNIIYEISDDGVLRRTDHNLTPIDSNKKNISNYKDFKISEDGIQRRTLPDIKVVKVFKPLATNEINRKNVTKYTVEKISEDGIGTRIQPNKNHIDTNGNTKNSILHENKIGNDIRVRKPSNVNVEDNHERIDTKEQNKNIIGKNTIYQNTKDEILGQTQQGNKVEKVNKASVTNEKNKNVDNTIYGINKDEERKETPPNMKEMLCDQAYTKFNLFLTQLHKASSSSQQQMDLSLKEFLEIYEIIQKFKSKLSSENEIVSSSVLIRELEQRLLENKMDPCRHEPNVIVKTIISDLVNALREVIHYMKVNGYDDVRMRNIVESLVNRLLPDINAIAVKECEERSPQELMDLLLSNVYTDKEFEGDEVQFATGYTLQGISGEDFLHTVSMQKLLVEIAKYRNL